MTDLDQIAGLRPDVDDPTPQWLAANRAALLERASRSPVRRPLPRWTRPAMIAAAAAGISVLAVVMLVPASSTLSTASAPAHFVYVKQGYQASDNGQVTVREAWYPLDGGQPASAQGDTHLCTVYDQTYNQRPDPITECPRLLPGAIPDAQGHALPEPPVIGWSHQQLQALPTDPTQLRARLYDLARQALATKPTGNIVDPLAYAAAHNVDDQVFLLISGALLKGIAPPETVAAFYQVLPTIPGVAATKQIPDAVGRPGTGFNRTIDQGDGPHVNTLIFGMDSHLFLGEKSTATGTPSMVVFSSGLVDKIGDRV